MNIIRIALNHLKFNDLDHEVLLKSFKALLVKLFGIFSSFLVSVIISNSLGANVLGIIDFSNKIISILVIFSLVGLNQIIIREVSKAVSINDFIRVNSVLKSARFIALLLSIISSIILFSLSEFISLTFLKDESLYWVIEIFSITIPFHVISHIYSSAVIGFNKIWQGNLVNQSITMICILIVFAIVFYLRGALNISVIVYSYFIGRFLPSFIFMAYYNKINQTNSNVFLNIRKELLSYSFPIFIASLSIIMFDSASTLILGFYESTEDIGFFNVCIRITLLLTLILQVSNTAISPKIAQLYSQNKTDILQGLISKMTLVSFLLSFLILLVLIFFGKSILSLWGSDFRSQYIILIILSFGQFINASTGCAGVILVMTGYEKIRRNISMLTLIIFLFSSVFLIKHYGIYGAAVSVSIAYIIENLLKVYFAYLKTGLKIFKI